MFSGRAVKMGVLISCLSTAAVLSVQTSPAQNVPRPASDKTLRQCEKELARDELQELVASGLVIKDGTDTASGPVKGGTNTGLVTGGAVTGVSYKAYKLSNTLQRKDVENFLMEHGLRAIRTFAPRIKYLVRGKVFRGIALVGILIGGAMMSHEGQAQSHPTEAPHPTDEASDRAIIAPMVQLGESERERLELMNMIRREFGSKDWLALWFAARSIAKFNGEQGEVIVFSRLQNCTDEDHPNAVFPKICNSEPSAVECLLKQERVRDTLKNMLSPITISNDHISWDASKFED